MSLGWEIYLDLMRVGHIFAGIAWIGLLYYFNFVQGYAFPKMEGPARNNAIVNLVPQALFVFRWSALATLLFGIAYIGGATAADGSGFEADLFGVDANNRFRSVLIGSILGTIMAANVWFIIWPNQKKIIAAVTAMAKEGKPANPDQPKWTRAATLGSRVNVMLSVPMLFFMVAARNLDSLWE